MAHTKSKFYPYKQSPFKEVKRTLSELLFLQTAPEAVIILCNEMMSDMVKTQKDSYADTLC